MKYKNFSDQRAKPKEARPLREVSIAKLVILQAQDIFCSKSLTITPSFFTATAYLTLFPVRIQWLKPFSPVTTSFVVIVTHTQLFLSQTSILICNGFLSNWNGN